MNAPYYSIEWAGTWKGQAGARADHRFHIPPVQGGEVLLDFSDGFRRYCTVESVIPLSVPAGKAPSDDDYAADIVLRLSARCGSGVVKDGRAPERS